MMLRSRNAVRLTVFVVAGTLPSIAGCSREHPGETARSTAAAATPAHLTAADLRKLSWIEGTWRGTGAATPPFYERYRFENDDTLVVEKLTDESAGTVEDTARYSLENGQFASSRAVATELTDSSITFARGANTFRWQTESADVWKAVLRTPATGNAPAVERVYRMERWPLARR